MSSGQISVRLSIYIITVAIAEVLTGPKIYAAQATPNDSGNQGTTRLHMDWFDAVNVMMWSLQNEDGSPGSALWHMFPTTSVPILSDYIFRTRPDVKKGDYNPILLQSVYLTSSDLQALREQFNVIPWTVEQRVGEAIFIPAGVPHQVGLWAQL